MYRQDVSSACRHVCLYTLRRRRRRGFFEGEPPRGRKGRPGGAYCAHPTRSPWVGKYMTVGTHSERGGEWPDGATTGETIPRDTKRVLKNAGWLRERGIVVCTWGCDANSRECLAAARRCHTSNTIVEGKRGRENSYDAIPFHILGFYYFARTQLQRGERGGGREHKTSAT